MASDYDKSDLVRVFLRTCAHMCALCSHVCALQVCAVLASVRCARMCALCSHVGAVLACVRCARLCPLCVRACEASRMCARSRTCSASADARASPHPPYERRGRGRVLACGHVLACAGAHWRRVSCCWLADGCVANLKRGNEESCDMRACVRVWSLHSAQWCVRVSCEVSWRRSAPGMVRASQLSQKRSGVFVARSDVWEGTDFTLAQLANPCDLLME